MRKIIYDFKKSCCAILVGTIIIATCACSNSSTVNTETTAASVESEVSGEDESGVAAQTETGEAESANVELAQKADAETNEWLAAEVVIGISMYYTDFEFEHIYIGPDDVIVEFTSEGENVIIDSESLDGERDEAGTRDLYSKDLGYASFDEGGKVPDDLSEYEDYTVDDLDELIKQSVLVTVYEH